MIRTFNCFKCNKPVTVCDFTKGVALCHNKKCNAEYKVKFGKRKLHIKQIVKK